MILSLKIASKFYQSYKKNTLMSLVSIISTVSIIIGIAVSIITMSIINGFEYELNNRILSIIPHGEIVPIKTPFHNWKSILNKIKKNPNIISADPYINFSGIIEFNNKRQLINIKTINLIEHKNINDYSIMNFIEQQSWQQFCECKNQIILGKGISDILNVKNGDWINILFVHNLNLKKKKLLSPKKVYVQVSGTLNLHSQFDDNLAIISLSDAKNYFNNKIEIDGIEIKVKNIFYVNKILKHIKNEFEEYVQIHSWMDNYGYIYHDIQLIKLITYLSVILIIGIACFNIIATLTLSIRNKHYEVAVLRSLGARNLFIQNIFLWHGFIMYFIASIVGTSIGILISINLTSIITKCMNVFESDLLPKGIYFINFIPSKPDILDVCIILSAVFLLGSLISWYISFKINQIKLIDILK